MTCFDDADLKLSATFTQNARTAPVLDGYVRPEGITLLTTTLNASEMYWRPQLTWARY